MKKICRFYKKKQDYYDSVINLLKKEGVEFIILNLPINIDFLFSGNDLDIVLSRSGFNNAEKILLKLGFIFNSTFLDSSQKVFSKITDSSFLINIHLHEDFKINGIKFFTFADIKKNSDYIDGFLYPSRKFEPLILLVTFFLQNKKHYIQRINTFEDLGCIDNNKYFYKFMYKFVKTISMPSILDKIFFNLFFIKFFPNIILFNIRKFFNFISRIFVNRGLCVTFIGIDGSGKSSQASLLRDSLCKLGYNANIEYFGLKATIPHLLLQKRKAKRIVNRPMSLKKKYSIKSLLLNYFYLVNYFFMYHYSYRKNRSNFDILIYDRSHIDLFWRLSNNLTKLYMFFIKLPHVCFYLKGSIDKITKRKKEHTIEVMSQLSAISDTNYQILPDAKTNKILIHTTQMSLMESHKKIINQTLIKFEKVLDETNINKF